MSLSCVLVVVWSCVPFVVLRPRRCLVLYRFRCCLDLPPCRVCPSACVLAGQHGSQHRCNKAAQQQRIKAISQSNIGFIAPVMKTAPWIYRPNDEDSS